jgi:hypothetical protein
MMLVATTGCLSSCGVCQDAGVSIRFFNECLRSRVVQAGLKDVIIKFVYKKGDKTDRNNYRTLSLINHFGSKVLELMVMIRVVAASEFLDAFFCLRMISSYCRGENQVSSLT